MDCKVKFNVNSYGAKAEEDMVNASAMLSQRLGTPRGCIFWCEQAIEKYFKHILAQTEDSENLVMRHKLLPLATKAGFSVSSADRYLLNELGRMYYERYPIDKGEEIPEDPTWEDVELAYNLALRVQDWTYSVVAKRCENTKTNIRKMNLQ